MDCWEWVLLQLKELKLNIHEFTERQTELSDDLFISLITSIRDTGGINYEPILIWRNNIINGRHRLKALKHIEAKYVNVRYISEEYNEEDIIEILKSENIRRDNNELQRAYEELNLNELRINNGEKKYSVKTLALRARCNFNMMKRCSSIFNRSKKSLELLLVNGNVDIIDKNNNLINVDTLTKLYYNLNKGIETLTEIEILKYKENTAKTEEVYSYLLDDFSEEEHKKLKETTLKLSSNKLNGLKTMREIEAFYNYKKSLQTKDLLEKLKNTPLTEIQQTLTNVLVELKNEIRLEAEKAGSQLL